MRKVTRIIKIHEINGYQVACLFSNGESRIIDFKEVFQQWKITESDAAYPLLISEKAFQRVEIIEGTFTWKNIQIASTDEEGKPIFYFFDVDPIVMYENSYPDPLRKPKIGLMLKQARLEMGLTQEALAKKIGVSKHYISKIENDQSSIELSSLTKIVEGGLERKLQISIV